VWHRKMLGPCAGWAQDVEARVLHHTGVALLQSGDAVHPLDLLPAQAPLDGQDAGALQAGYSDSHRLLAKARGPSDRRVGWVAQACLPVEERGGQGAQHDEPYPREGPIHTTPPLAADLQTLGRLQHLRYLAGSEWAAVGAPVGNEVGMAPRQSLL